MGSGLGRCHSSSRDSVAPCNVAGRLPVGRSFCLPESSLSRGPPVLALLAAENRGHFDTAALDLSVGIWILRAHELASWLDLLLRSKSPCMDTTEVSSPEADVERLWGCLVRLEEEGGRRMLSAEELDFRKYLPGRRRSRISTFRKGRKRLPQKGQVVLRLESSAVQPAMISSSCTRQSHVLHREQLEMRASMAYFWKMSVLLVLQEDATSDFPGNANFDRGPSKEAELSKLVLLKLAPLAPEAVLLSWEEAAPSNSGQLSSSWRTWCTWRASSTTCWLSPQLPSRP